MKNKFIFLFCLFFGLLFSEHVSLSDAQKTALNLVLERDKNNQVETIKNIFTDEEDGTVFFYTVEFKPSGFAIISADDRVTPVLGYSFYSDLSLSSLPLQLEAFLDNVRAYIKYITIKNIPASDRIFSMWESYLSDSVSLERDFRSVDPLITANWNQGGAWNDMCPGNALVGCVAVAMGQVMYYWSHPVEGSGYAAYYDPDYGNIYADFGETVYDFDSMQDNSATEASQLLLFHAGVAVHMDYGESGSGAFVCYTGLNAKTALRDNFNYNQDITCASRVNYSDSEWADLLIEQLENGWPIIYRAYQDGGGAGHAWNVDGYDGDLFHCNWGWGGSSNGYFSLGSMGGFNQDQAAVINIIPDGLEPPMALFDFEVDNYTVFFTDLSVNINSELIAWNWDFGDGNVSDEVSPIHSYDSEGVYYVTLEVTSSYGMDSDPYVAEVVIEACTDPIDECGLCGGENVYVDCNGQCGYWTPICTDEDYAGYIGPSACEGYIGVGSDNPNAESGGSDDCGVCEGDNSTCSGCTDPQAENYSVENIVDDGSCTYIFYGPGYAIDFDGEDDRITVTGEDIESVFGEGSDSFTISAWIYPEPSVFGSPYEVLLSNSVLDVDPSAFIGEYYSSGGGGGSPTFGELVLTRYDDVIDFNWGGGSPDPSIPNNDYQVRWTGTVFAESQGEYSFRTHTDDGVRLYIDGELIIDHWFDMGPTSKYGNKLLTQGLHECVMEYYENGGGAVAELYWTPPGESETLVQPAESSAARNIELGTTDGNLMVTIENPCGDNLLTLGEGELQLESWHHIALTYSGGTVTAYLNGNIYTGETCGSSLADAPGASMTVGASPFEEIYFSGILDELRIWNRSRNAQEIQIDMFDRIEPDSEGLKGYWRLDEDGGDIVFDATSGDSHGQLDGVPERVESTAPFTLPPFITLTVSDDAGSTPTDLKIGMIQDVTDEYDYWIDLYAPPAPPAPAWDAAIFNSLVNDRFYIDMRPMPEADDITEWAVDIQPDVETEEVTLSWNYEELGEGLFTLTDAFGGVLFSVDMQEVNTYSFPPSFNRVLIQHRTDMGMEIVYNEGWNIVGLPLAGDETSYQILFPEAMEGTLFSFTDLYQSAETLEVGEGYLLRMSDESVVNFSGSTIENVILYLGEGWNLISGLSSVVSANTLYLSELIAEGTLYGFSDVYFLSDSIEPGRGYWIRATEDGEITLSPGVSAKQVSFVSRTEEANSISFSNGTHSTELFFGVEIPEEEILSYSLPPLFPEMAFDARFTGDSKVLLESGEIELLNTAETITLSYDIPIEAGEQMNWVLTSDNGGDYILEGTGVVTVQSAERFVVKREPVIPTTFALHQNFPNPFNPTTTLRYDLPKKLFVTISIYNMLGDQIKVLVNRYEGAGFKSVQWDARDNMGRDVSAGVYLYKIEVGEFVETRKMVLLK
tara:strand:+ start:530 stop:4801 length:4272 start_codon:yes stop_codon:yes gene_type:complete